MKKYLLTSAATLAFCGLFTSCTHDLGYDESSAQNSVVKKYEQAFITAFGQPDPNQEWGFGVSTASTRAMTRSAYPNANQWASQGYNVPDPLKPGQKARVQFYFQTVKNPGGTQDYGQIDFFVQQVYDGCTDAITKYDGYTSPTYSAEEYKAADNNTMIQSGEHMDHLTAGSDNEHIYNFNNGTCSTNPNVGDNGAALDTKQHSDEIMLMLNTKTDKFGYANSDASYVRTDRYRQVAGSVIDQYISAHYTEYKNWLDKHNGIEDKEVDDDWHRSFIGFDFDMLPDQKCLVCTPYDKNGNPIWNITSETKIDHYVYSNIHYSHGSESYDRKVYNLDGTFSQYDSSDPEIVIDGKTIPYVKAQTNQYCALGENANIGIGGMDNFNDYQTEAAYDPSGTNDNTLYLNNLPNEQSDRKALNMKFIAKLVRAGYLPVADKGLKRWVKIGGCADQYYSDWIVSFLPAEPEASFDGVLRVVCEDLSVTQASDWDFNDVVFDVQLYDDNKKVKITLKAAGGTLPLCVGDDNSESRTHEVHELFAKANPGSGITTSTMINTRNTGAKYTITGCKEASFYLTIKDEWKEGHSSGEALLKSVAKNIPIDVYKTVDGEKRWVPMEWKKGNPTAKMAFGTNYNWCDERDDIRNTFTAEIDNSGQYVSTFEYFVKGVLGDNWYKVEKVTQAQADEFRNK